VVACYFAYGSNMNPERVRERGIRFDHACGGRLHGFVLAFDKTARQHRGVGHANLHYHPEGIVEGVLYWLSALEEIGKMDPFERAPINYSREVVQVRVSAADLPAAGAQPAGESLIEVSSWTYFANPAVRRPDLLPPRSYMNHLLAGQPYLSEDYLSMLDSWPCEETK
jgi:hypothetical protein